MMAAPDRSLEQRLTALRSANVVRERRKNLKRELKAGQKTLADVLAHPPDYLETMKIMDLLLAAPKWGRVKANGALARCRISPSRSVGGLTERQRRELRACIARAPGGQIDPTGQGRQRFAEQMSATVHTECGVGGR